MFEMYTFTAVRITTNSKYGWVSLSSLKELTRFIQYVHRKKPRGKTWIVVLKYDPSVTLITKNPMLNRQPKKRNEKERSLKGG
ncbi:hypothetical protein F5Y10DRAFT_244116 [Nemania abortiva]|nr:hypothetical protein F5Y10DRAFT_244116 [Nemania abortiva]